METTKNNKYVYVIKCEKITLGKPKFCATLDNLYEIRDGEKIIIPIDSKLSMCFAKTEIEAEDKLIAKIEEWSENKK